MGPDLLVVIDGLVPSIVVSQLRAGYFFHVVHWGLFSAERSFLSVFRPELRCNLGCRLSTCLFLCLHHKLGMELHLTYCFNF